MDQIKLENGLAVVRFPFNLSTITNLKKLIDFICNNVSVNEDCLSIYKTAYYSVEIDNYNISEIYSDKDTSLKNSLKSGSYPFSIQSYKKFSTFPQKQVIFEIEYPAKANVVDFRYLYMIAEYCKTLSTKFQFRIFREYEHGYIPIDREEYMRIRIFSLLTDCNDMFYFYRRYNGRGWARLFTASNIEERISEGLDIGSGEFNRVGRVIPIIEISAETYNALNDRRENKNSIIAGIMDKYLEFLIHLYGDESKEVIKMADGDNFLERFIFTAMCAQMGDRLPEKRLRVLHEQCINCAQGIIQLVENAFFHAANRKEVGCATLTIRIRNKEDADYIHGDEFSDVERFVEIYVVDLIYDEKKYAGIVSKFIENAKNRYDKKSDKEKEIWRKQFGTPDGWKGKITLRDMFEGGSNNSVYNRYLSSPDVIAYHYGLEIFSSALETQGGYLGVWSKEFYEMCSKKYATTEIDGWCGTSYVIYIPLNKRNDINYEDSIIFNDLLPDQLPKYRCIKLYTNEIENILNEYETSLHNEFVSKYNCVKMVNDFVNPEVLKANSSEIVICVLDCKNVQNINAYEILAKAVFILMSEENSKVDNVAFLNLVNKNDVIKMFRQFALFYNRQGMNTSMEKKNVYIVDRNAEMDISFGGNIKEIKSNMQTQLIWGGVGETAKRIIDCLR